MNPRSERARAEHIARIEALGCTDLGDPWRGANVPRRLICPAGHEVSPHPASIQKGRGPCRVCAGNDSDTAFRAHLERIEALGCTDLGDPWEGMLSPRRLICGNGHEVSPIPNSIQQGQGPCRVCAGQDPGKAFHVHLERMKKLGYTDLGDPWMGVDAPRRLICPAGHEISIRPTGFQQGRRPCRTCSLGTNKEEA